jgi:hypothetical protein
LSVQVIPFVAKIVGSVFLDDDPSMSRIEELCTQLISEGWGKNP